MFLWVWTIKQVITPKKQVLYFYENGYYKIENELLFQPPEFSRKMLYHIYNSNLAVLAKLKGTVIDGEWT
jgi:hypothetical protein